MDTLERLEALVSKLEDTDVKVGGASLIRAYSNRVLQWRAVFVVTYGFADDFGSREINGYGSNGRDAIAAVEREVESFLKQRTAQKRPLGA